MNQRKRAEEVRAMLRNPHGWKIHHNDCGYFLKRGTMEIYWTDGKRQQYIVFVFDPTSRIKNIPEIETLYFNDPNKAIEAAYWKATKMLRRAIALTDLLEGCMYLRLYTYRRNNSSRDD